MNIKKVIIWGHKLHSHTHSYIHNSYFNAFKNMGYDTYWFDNNDDISNIIFDSCIFFTEGQVDSNIPLLKSCFYILHHCDVNKYSNYNYINLCNYVNDCKLGNSYNYPNSTVEKITYFSYYDDKNKALYQPWATDLFPDDFMDIVDFDKNKKNVYYIGSIWSENYALITNFVRACMDNGKQFINKRFISDEEGRQLIRDSFISPDIRCQHHVNVGYIPCRTFKNISYGVIPATNSKFVKDFFGDNLIPYSESTYDLFDISVKFNQQPDYKDKLSYLMNEVKLNHTYLTRVKSILNIINNI